MIKLIGKENCSRCEITKNVLKQKNIDFEYILFETMNPEEAKEVKKKSMKSGNMSFPIIIKDDKIITLQEV